MDEHLPGVYRPKLEVDANFTIIPNDWIRKSGLSPQANFLLIYLMTHEIGYEITFQQMQVETLLGIKGIRSALAELQKKGWLEIERTHKPNGQLGTYRYTIVATRVPQGTVVAGTVAEGTDIKKTSNKENNSKEVNALFDEFWTTYPRKLDKAKAFRAFRSALKRAKFEDILAGVIAYRNDPKRDPDYTKYPATWLNNDAWENAASLPEVNTDRREKALKASEQFMKEWEELAEKAAPAPKCPHGNNIALCQKCLN